MQPLPSPNKLLQHKHHLDMMVAHYIIRGALFMAPLIINSDATMSFLPRRYYHPVPYTTTLQLTSSKQCISVLRGGTSFEEEFEDANDEGVGSVIGEENSAASQQGISDQSSSDTEMEDILPTAEDNDDDAGAGANDQSEEKTMASSSSQTGDDNAWGEEIRRTRAYYSAPRLSSQPDKILITGTATTAAGTSTSSSSSSNNFEENGATIGTTTEDERVFGNAQTASYSMQEGIYENKADSTEQEVEEQAETDHSPNLTMNDDMDSDQTNSVEESEAIVEQQAPETTAASGQETASHISTVSEVEDVDVDIVDESNIPPRDDGVVDVSGQLSADEKDVAGEQALLESSSNANDDEEKDSVADENKVVEEGENAGSLDIKTTSEEIPQEDDTENATIEDDINDREMALESSQDDDVIDEPVAEGLREVKSILADEVAEAPFEDDDEDDAGINHGGQEIAHSISDVVALEEEDLLVPRWQQATKAVASNKLVEEGLRRLRRRDGDAPSIPYVITRAMQRVLVDDLGYDPLEVMEMRPDVAVVIVAESLERPDLEALPSRFYNIDVEPAAIAIEEVGIREGKQTLKGTLTSLFERLRKEVSVLFSGKDPQSIAIIAASLGVALSFIFGPSHGNKKSWEEIAAPSPELPSSIDDIVDDLSYIEDDLDELDGATSPPELQPDDLDKTWLDKLISLVSKPFERA